MDNTAIAYQHFLTKYPNAKQRSDVVSRLGRIIDEQDWKSANSINTIQSYQEYVSKHKEGSFVILAYERIRKFKAEEEAWTATRRINSIEAYTNYLASFPHSQHAFEAKQQIAALHEVLFWDATKSTRTIKSFEEYLKKYPEGIHARNARDSILLLKHEQQINPIWEKALQKNTYQAYYQFYRDHPNTLYGKTALEKMEVLDQLAWGTAQRINTTDSYNKYLQDIPDGQFVSIANKKLIDLEVDRIFRGEHGQLPPMEKLYGFSARNSTHSVVQISNDTPYQLTIWYSGSESKKIQLESKRNSSVKLQRGKYRIAASVKAHNVSNYVGEENLDGNDYQVTYYIENR